MNQTTKKEFIEPKKSGREKCHEGSGRESPEKVDQKIELKRLKFCPCCNNFLRKKGKRKRTITKIVLNVSNTLKNSHYVNFFKPLLEELKLKVLQINADKCYDDEKLYRYCFDKNILPMISMKEYKNAATGYGLEPVIGKGWFRKKASSFFDEKL